MRAGPDETENQGVYAAAEAAAKGACVPVGSILSQEKMRSQNVQARSSEGAAAGRGLRAAAKGDSRRREPVPLTGAET